MQKYSNIFYILFYSCEGKADFSAAIFSVTWSFSNIFLLLDFMPVKIVWLRRLD